MNQVKKLLFLILALTHSSWLPGQRVEPPYWWVDMPSKTLQLMIHHPDIRGYKASLTYNGISINHQDYGDSPHYTFLYLNIAPGTRAGSVPITFTKGRKKFILSYDLKERKQTANANQGFDSSDVIYLLMPDRFANGDPDNDNVAGMLETADRSIPNARHGGDIKGIKDHLDYIQSIGMTAVWLTPVFENNMTPEYGAYHGYAATDLYKIDRRFGTNEEFKAFVNACHKKGLKVIMDMIHNHIGDQHWWMQDLPAQNWIHDFEKYGTSNFRGSVQSDPYASEYDLDKLQKAWFVPSMPDLNQQNQWLADYLIQNTLWWIEFSGVDGIRMDTYVYPYKDYMACWAKTVLEAYPQFNIVGEAWVRRVAHESYWQQGTSETYNSNLMSITDFQLHFAIRDAMKEDFGWEEGLRKLYYTLSEDRLYTDPMQNVIFLDNHDLERFYTDVGEDKSLWKMAYAYLMTTRGIPQVYYGTELMLANDDAKDDARKRPDMMGGWPDDPRSVFEASERTPTENEAFAYVSKLTRWRKGSEVIHKGKLMHFVPENNLYVFFRYYEKETVMVVMNMNEGETSIDPKPFHERLWGYSKAKDILTDEVKDITSSFMVPGKRTSIYELK
ncbi:MAG: glycoside hydrolase family 13 protein [Cyclobacteriaceae bacterium]|nr:glycoside hydrolase family 13 protein [Cyclobacteriaceae bacterium HetDA_MAG_MS6]